MLNNLPEELPVLPNDRLALEQGYYYDNAAAQRVVDFFEKFLRHSKGQFAGKTFKLSPWQEWRVIRPLYGWKRPDGRRRFNHAHVELPKKNGKSTLCSGLSLYHLIADKEAGAEVISASGSRDQASIVFNEALNMVDSSSTISKRVKVRVSKKEIEFPLTKSIYKVIAADAGRQEGLNVSACIIDELHTFKNRRLWDTLKYAGAMRSQPLTIVITTAGDEDITTLYHEQTEYATKIIEGIIPDLNYFAFIAKADSDDDIMDPATWAKANPNYGVTISEENMRQAAIEAVNNPAAYNAFLRYRLNIRASSEVKWMSDAVWMECENLDKPEEKPGDVCYVGMDLSSNIDIGGYLLFFPETYTIKPRLWAPKSNQQALAKKRTKYELWAQLGLLTIVEATAIDYDAYIKPQLDKDDKEYKIKRIAMDPWNATQFSLKLINDGYEVEPYRQGYPSMNPAMKELERLVLQKLLVHKGNKVMRWMMSNLIIDTDVNLNIKPAKKPSKESIDGIVMLIMAIGLWMIDQQKESVYKTRGLRYL